MSDLMNKHSNYSKTLFFKSIPPKSFITHPQIIKWSFEIKNQKSPCSWRILMIDPQIRSHIAINRFFTAENKWLQRTFAMVIDYFKYQWKYIHGVLSMSFLLKQKRIWGGLYFGSRGRRRSLEYGLWKCYPDMEWSWKEMRDIHSP